MSKTVDYFSFIRVSDEQYIDSLQKEGHIYCNTIRYFRSLENSARKGDVNEGKAYLKQVESAQILVNGKKVAVASKAQLYLDHQDDKGNIYCLYGVKTELVNLTKKALQKIKIEDFSDDFGKSVLLIHDPSEFISRINQALLNLGKDYNFFPVNYYNPLEYQGELSPFYKAIEYSHQNEVRLWIPNKKEEPFEFFIGDISDISYKINVGDLDKIEVEVLIPENSTD